MQLLSFSAQAAFAPKTGKPIHQKQFQTLAESYIYKEMAVFLRFKNLIIQAAPTSL